MRSIPRGTSVRGCSRRLQAGAGTCFAPATAGGGCRLWRRASAPFSAAGPTTSSSATVSPRPCDGGGHRGIGEHGANEPQSHRDTEAQRYRDTEIQRYRDPKNLSVSVSLWLIDPVSSCWLGELFARHQVCSNRSDVTR